MESVSYSYALPKKTLAFLASHAEVKDWYDEISQTKSSRTALDYIVSLHQFLTETDRNPKHLLKSSSREAYELMKKYALEKKKQKKSPKTIHRQWWGIKSFLVFKGIDFHGDFPFKVKTTYLDKIPTKEELKKILDVAPLATKVPIHFIAYAGLRPEDLCELTYSSIKEDFEKGMAPCCVYVPQGKGDDLYVTFIPESTVKLLTQYFEIRKAYGEKLNESSPIIVDLHTRGPQFKGIRRKTLSTKITEVMKKSSVNRNETFRNKVRRMRPYSLRKYFRSKLSGKIPSEFIEAMMGHTQGLAQIYGGQRDLDPDTTQKMRGYYKDAQADLLADTRIIEITDTDKMEEIKKDISKTYEGEIGSLKQIVSVLLEKVASGEVPKQQVKDILEGLQPQGGNGSEKKGRKAPTQRVIKEADLENHLQTGEWKFISAFGTDRCVLERI